MSTHGGGQAFPSLTASGMTLRQWYAGQALAGMAPTPNGPVGQQGVAGVAQSYQGTAAVLAAVAFKIADAMLAEGNKP